MSLERTIGAAPSTEQRSILRVHLGCSSYPYLPPCSRVARRFLLAGVRVRPASWALAGPRGENGHRIQPVQQCYHCGTLGLFLDHHGECPVVAAPDTLRSAASSCQRTLYTNVRSQNGPPKPDKICPVVIDLRRFRKVRLWELSDLGFWDRELAGADPQWRVG